MEIAALLSLIPDPLPEDLLHHGSASSSPTHHKSILFTNYPLVLPQLFLLRVTALLDLKEALEQEASLNSFSCYSFRWDDSWWRRGCR